MSGRGRQPSGPWSRLKPVNLDPLESLGLPSKGDNRLLDHKTQEKYYTKIVERYLKFCSVAGRRDELLRRFASLAIAEKSTGNEAPPGQASNVSMPSAGDLDAREDAQSQRDLSVLVMAMRKLREGIVASKRIDDFAVQVYIFCIRFSILVKQMESYHPALLYLLRKMHPTNPLSSVELQEFVGYLVLDTACRQGNLSDAHVSRHHFQLKDAKVDAILSALVHDNYYMFWKIRRSVDGHKVRLMEFAEDRMRLHTLKCLGKTYLSLEREFVERVTGSTWTKLVAENGVGWELQEHNVVIRKPKGR